MSFLSITSHILDSNGVWYCSFWSEGSINPLNLNNIVPDFFYRSLRPRRAIPRPIQLLEYPIPARAAAAACHKNRQVPISRKPRVVS